jgi:plasmid stabilization system protein ParE
MALKIVWTKQAAKGYAKIIHYLETEWTAKELVAFKQEMTTFFELLRTHPEILQASSKKKNYRRGPINEHTMLTYRIKPRKQQIELINIRGTKQKPLK